MLQLMKRTRPSIHDIAREAGVSITTVSHSLNGRGRVQASTRQRVLRTAKRLGYTANAHARRLVTGRHMTIALQVAGFGRDSLIPDSAYYIQVLNSASSTALGLGYMPMLVPSGDALDVASFPIDGALIIDPTGDETLLKSAADSDAAILAVGRVLGDDSVPWVDNDHVHLTLRMLDHLERMGYERPALLTGLESQSYAADALVAYRRWTDRRGLEPITASVSGAPTVAAGMRAARRLLRRKRAPDAIHASFDVLALGALAVARELCLRVPEDLGIAGAVDSYALRTANPPVTGFDLNAAQIGRSAISLLVDSIDADGEDTPVPVIIDAKLNRRRSTKRNATP
jgi:DNA-binding LacI/PurR family transcriptional regulator